MNHKRVAASLLALCWLSGFAVAQGTSSLQPGQPIEREIAGGESHTYQIRLAAGQFVRVVVDQKGIDVALTLAGPDGKQVAETDLTAHGTESLSYEAAASGDTTGPHSRYRVSGGEVQHVTTLKQAAAL